MNQNDMDTQGNTGRYMSKEDLGNDQYNNMTELRKNHIKAKVTRVVTTKPIISSNEGSLAS